MKKYPEVDFVLVFLNVFDICLNYLCNYSFLIRKREKMTIEGIVIMRRKLLSSLIW